MLICVAIPVLWERWQRRELLRLLASLAMSRPGRGRQGPFLVSAATDRP